MLARLYQIRDYLTARINFNSRPTGSEVPGESLVVFEPLQNCAKQALFRIVGAFTRQRPDVGPWIRVESFAGVVDVTVFSISAVIATQIDR